MTKENNTITYIEKNNNFSDKKTESIKNDEVVKEKKENLLEFINNLFNKFYPQCNEWYKNNIPDNVIKELPEMDNIMQMKILNTGLNLFLCGLKNKNDELLDTRTGRIYLNNDCGVESWKSLMEDRFMPYIVKLKI